MIRYQGYSTLEVLEGADNYNKWISEKVGVSLNSPLLEIGSGIGNISRFFFGIGEVWLSDIDTGMIRKLKKRFSDKKNVHVITLDITKTPTQKLRKYFSSIVAVNVLEHIEDDEKAVRNMSSLLKKRGKLVLLVPAKERAYTRLDKSLGHYRRYEKAHLIQLLERNGLKVRSISFFNFVGLISWVLRDKIEGNNYQMKTYQIKLFDSLVPVLKILESLIPLPVGISLTVVAEKI